MVVAVTCVDALLQQDLDSHAREFVSAVTAEPHGFVTKRPASLDAYLAGMRMSEKATVEFLEDSGILGRISRLLAPIDLPFGFSLSGVAGRLSVPCRLEAFLDRFPRYRIGSVAPDASSQFYDVDEFRHGSSPVLGPA